MERGTLIQSTEYDHFNFAILFLFSSGTIFTLTLLTGFKNQNKSQWIKLKFKAPYLEATTINLLIDHKHALKLAAKLVYQKALLFFGTISQRNI